MTMRIAWQMARANLLQLMRDRRALIMMFLMPLVLTAILSFAFSQMFGGKGIAAFPVGIYDADRTPASSSLVQVMAEQKSQLSVVSEPGVDLGRADLDSGRTSVFVSIPQGFGQHLQSGSAVSVDVESTLANDVKRQVVQAIVDAYGKQAGINEYVAERAGPRAVGAIPGVQSSTLSAGLHPITSGSYYTVAMLTMFMLMTAFNYAQNMVGERQTDRYRRMLASPASRQALTMGHWFATVVVLFVQGALFTVFTRILFGTVLGPWTQVLVLTLVYAVALSGISVMFGTFVANRQLMEGIGGIGSQVIAALGGSIIPVYAFPPVVRTVSGLLPNGIALNGLLNCVSGIAMTDLIWPIVYLGGFGVVLGLVAGMRYGTHQ